MKKTLLAIALGTTLLVSAPVWGTTGGDGASLGWGVTQPGPFDGVSRQAWDAHLVKAARITLVSGRCSNPDEKALSPFARYCHVGGTHVSLRPVAARH